MSTGIPSIDINLRLLGAGVRDAFLYEVAKYGTEPLQAIDKTKFRFTVESQLNGQDWRIFIHIHDLLEKKNYAFHGQWVGACLGYSVLGVAEGVYEPNYNLKFYHKEHEFYSEVIPESMIDRIRNMKLWKRFSDVLGEVDCLLEKCTTKHDILDKFLDGDYEIVADYLHDYGLSGYGEYPLKFVDYEQMCFDICFVMNDPLEKMYPLTAKDNELLEELYMDLSKNGDLIEGLDNFIENVLDVFNLDETKVDWDKRDSIVELFNDMCGSDFWAAKRDEMERLVLD